MIGDKVQGRCPACGTALLALGSGGYVVCTLDKCPDPSAVSDLLLGAGNRGLAITRDGVWWVALSGRWRRTMADLTDALAAVSPVLASDDGREVTEATDPPALSWEALGAEREDEMWKGGGWLAGEALPVVGAPPQWMVWIKDVGRLFCPTEDIALIVTDAVLQAIGGMSPEDRDAVRQWADATKEASDA
jgi:hypothetical protein